MHPSPPAPLAPEAPSRAGTPPGPAGSRALSIAGILVGCLVLVGFGARALVDTRRLLTPASRGAATARAASFRCIEERITGAVPAGARVHFAVDRRTDPDGLWHQRATEGTYPRYEVVATAEDAEVVVGFGPMADGCPVLRVRPGGRA